MNPSGRRRRHAQFVAACAALLVVLATSRIVQGLYTDPAQQLRAVQQRVNGESTSMNRWVHPDSADVSRDVGQWIILWTPGTELFAYPLMRAGLTMGASVRVIAATCLVIGAVGWVTWFSLFALPDWMLLALAATFPFVRYVSNGLFLYSAEMLAFASAPWLLMTARAYLDRRTESPSGGAARALGVGALLGAAYWLKGSLAFVAVGALAAIAFCEWRRRSGSNRWWVTAGAAAAGTAIPFLVLTVLNRLAGGESTNQVTDTFRWQAPGWRTVLDAIALPALQLTDAGALWQYLLMHPAHPVVRDAAWLGLIGLPGGLLLWWLVCRPSVGGAAATLARGVFLASVGLLAGIWAISVVTHEWRHLASAAFAVLPLALADARARWTRSAPLARAAFAAAGVFYLCVPLAYGVTSVVQKVRRFPPDYQPGPARIYNPQLSETNIRAVRDTLLALGRPDDVWYLMEPISALDLPVRSVISGADFRDPDDLRADRFFTSRPVRVHALLPSRFESNGKGPIVRASFPQADAWASTTIAGSDYRLWTADLHAGR
ncbi:MAG: hypothetical protein LAO77_00660 [Acidobacteriia bacterium]|nr:hypothetical protein [Terriglobia bacterium]